jgi:hypothetical protein
VDHSWYWYTSLHLLEIVIDVEVLLHVLVVVEPALLLLADVVVLALTSIPDATGCFLVKNSLNNFCCS